MCFRQITSALPTPRACESELLAGAILTETIFAWPGMGKWVYDAILGRDYPVVQSGVLLIALVFVLANLLVDISYAYLDPRIHYD
jgi:peptide/nickel transport system permease protein